MEEEDHHAICTAIDALSSSTLVVLLLSGSTFVLEALRMHCSSFSGTWLRLSGPRFSVCHLHRSSLLDLLLLL